MQTKRWTFLNKFGLALVKFIISLAILLIAILQIFSIVHITIETLVLVGFVIFLWASTWLQDTFQSIEVPGKVKFELRVPVNKIIEESIRAGLFESKEIPFRRSIRGGGGFTPLFIELAQEDPLLSLAGLRIEMESSLRKLAEIKLEMRSQDIPLNRILLILTQGGFITTFEENVFNEMIGLLNNAVHGKRSISSQDAKYVAEVGNALLHAIYDKIDAPQPGGVG